MKRDAHSKGIIIRVQHGRENPYTKVANALLADSDLTFRALGVLVYLLSKPNDWTIRLAELVKSHGEGKDAVQGAIRLLKRLGYLDIMERRFRGQFMYVWVVWETRQVRKHHHEQPNLFEHILKKAAPGSLPVDQSPLFNSVENAADRCGKSAPVNPIKAAILAKKTGAEKPASVKPITENPPLLRTEVERTEQQQQPKAIARNHAAANGHAAAAERAPLREALTAVGVGEPTRSRLIGLSGLTAAIVRRCAAEGRERGKGTGAIILNMETAAEQARTRAAHAAQRASGDENKVEQRRLEAVKIEADRQRVADAIAGLTDDELHAHAEAVKVDSPFLRDADPSRSPLLQTAIADRLAKASTPACTPHDGEVH